MPLSNTIGTYLNDLDALPSKSRFLASQNPRKQQQDRLSILHGLVLEMGVSVESLKA